MKGIFSANPNITVMKGDLQDLYDTYSGGSLKNEGYRYVPSEFEVGLIRSLYGESTCSSTFGKKFDEEREKQAKKLADLELARKVFEEAKARAEAEARAKEEAQVVAKANAAIDAANQAAAAADAQAAAELKAKQEVEAKAKAEAEVKAKRESVNKKSTITCVKGKTVKKVTAVKPKCRKGYKKK
jgi:membrane protein involved in colicin uptake